MNRPENLFEQIQGYLQGTLPDAHLEEFETELAQNTELQHKVELARLTDLALRRHKLYQLKELTASIDKEERTKRKITQIVLGSLGLLLVMTGIAYWFYASNKETTALPTTKPVAAPLKKTTPVKTEKSTTEESTALPTLPVPNAVHPATKTTAQANRPPTLPLEQKLERTPQEAPTPTPVPIASAPVHPSLSEVPVPKPELKEPEKERIIDPCSHVFLDAYVKIEPTCTNSPSGKIHVSGLKGGKSPYRIHILNETKQLVPNEGMTAGIYSVRLQDAQNCVRDIEGFVVKEENCARDFEFNPFNGELLDLGMAPQSGTLTLYDKVGNVYLYKSFEKGEQITWNGNSTKGEAHAGYFLFAIHYQDKTIRKGTITVNR